MSKKHATTGKATPAIAQLENAGITFRVVDYEHDADHMDDGYGMEAAQKLGVNAEQVCKTLMVDTGEKRVVGIVPVNGRLSMKAIASAVHAKKSQYDKPRCSPTRKRLRGWWNQPIWSAYSSRNRSGC